MTAPAEVAEGVRATLAAYTHALDDGRTDDVVATFTSDAAIDIAGQGTFQGTAALREAYAGWLPRGAQRHLVLNTLVEADGADEARATSDVVFLLRTSVGWSVQLVGRYTDALRRVDDRWLFTQRTAVFA